MQIRVLGPVEIVDPPTRLSPKQRTLLALLVAAGGQALSVDALVEELWPDRAPTHPSNVVQQYISRLRVLLGDPAGAMLRTAPNGYRLTGVAVDAELFTRLLEAPTGENPAGALERLEEALSTWRGGAYADVPATHRITAEIARLDELRLMAEEARADAALTLGLHSKVIGDLQRLVADHPLREQLWGHLIRALWHGGRSAEALDAYRRLTETLDLELGVLPGPELRDLEQSLLGGQAPPAASATQIPRQLPAAPSVFSGRRDALAALDGLVRAAADVVVVSTITGSAGIGKTSLALHWAHSRADQFPDGQMYLNLRGFDAASSPASVEECLGRLLDGLGVASEGRPPDAESCAALYRSRIAGKQMLIVLDNASSYAQVEPLLPGAAGSMVVVTSRKRLEALNVMVGAAPIHLDLLSFEEARQLLTGRIGARRALSEPAATEQLIDLCGSLPLSLSIVAARAVVRPETSLSELVADLERSRLDSLFAGEPSTDVRSVFSWSLRHLSSPAATVFALLGLHPGPSLTLPALASLGGLTLRAARRVADELIGASLLIPVGPSRYAMHDLLRAYAAELADAEPDDVRQAATVRLVNHYAHTAGAGASLLGPPSRYMTTSLADGVSTEELNEKAAVAWFKTERHVLIAILDLAERAGLVDAVLALAFSAEAAFETAGFWCEADEAIQSAFRTATRTEHLASLHRTRARLHYYRRDVNLTEVARDLQHSLTLSTEIADPTGQAESHMGLAAVAADTGEGPTAIDHLETAADIFDKSGNPVAMGRALNNLAWRLLEFDEPGRALSVATRAYELEEQSRPQRANGETLDTLGLARLRLGEPRTALELFQLALARHRDSGHRFEEAETLIHLGEAHQVLGAADRARSSWQESHKILLELGDPLAEKARSLLTALGVTPTRHADPTE